MEVILEAALVCLGATPPKRLPCVRHEFAGSSYVERCYACESAHEPKLKNWLSTLRSGHGTAASPAQA
jgi:hypothetical protein